MPTEQQAARVDRGSCFSLRSTSHGGRFFVALARRWRSPCLTRWCRRRRCWRRPRPRRSRASSAVSCRTARPPATGCRDAEGALPAELPFNWKSLEPFRDQHRDPERPALALGGTAAGRDRRRPLGRGRVHVRRQAKEDCRCGRLQRHDDRPDHRAEDRHAVADSVAAAGRRRSRRELEQLRRRLQLHLHQHDLVGVADLAAADGAESADGVRAHVRRRQHGRGARCPAQARQQHPRLADRQPVAHAHARSAPPTASGSTTTPPTSARSSVVCRSR